MARRPSLTGLLIRLHGFALHFHIDFGFTGIDNHAAIYWPDMIDSIGPGRTSHIYLS